jgi:hypothetical protein
VERRLQQKRQQNLPVTQNHSYKQAQSNLHLPQLQASFQPTIFQSQVYQPYPNQHYYQTYQPTYGLTLQPSFGLNKVQNQVFVKTKMCPHLQVGNCQAGAACRFAHSLEELRSKPNLTKTKVPILLLNYH